MFSEQHWLEAHILKKITIQLSKSLAWAFSDTITI